MAIAEEGEDLQLRRRGSPLTVLRASYRNHGGSCCIRFNRQHRGSEAAQDLGVFGIAFGQDLNPGVPVGGHPISGDVGGDILGGDTLGLELLSELIERDPQGRGDRRFGSYGPMGRLPQAASAAARVAAPHRRRVLVVAGDLRQGVGHHCNASISFWSVGGRSTSLGLSDASIVVAASWMSLSFSSWSLGTRSLSVLVCETSRAPIAAARPRSQRRGREASISIALAPVCGFFLSSRNVATDSTFGLCKCSGLKSNCSQNSSGEASTTTRMVTTTTGIRCSSRNRSTGAVRANPWDAVRREGSGPPAAPATR